MEFYLFPIFAFLCLALVLSHASLPSEDYWRRALPNTPMPKSMEDLLRSDNSSDWDLETPARFGPDALDLRNYFRPSGGSSTRVIKNKANSFFFEKDLHRGATMKIPFTKAHKGAAFLSREVANSIPFSINKFPQILNRFSAKPKSVKGKLMKETIVDCESPGVGEDKFCATSLESLIDMVISEFGNNKNLLPFSSEVNGTEVKEFKIGGIAKMGGDKTMACHKMEYPYAVFYCHNTPDTRTYMVNLLVVANDKANQKMKSKAVAVCHLNTSTWDPNHLAFLELKVKPGTGPICHFFRNSDIVWVSN